MEAVLRHAPGARPREPHVRAAEGRSATGSTRTAILGFRAATAGKTALRLAYTRPWEKDVAPAKTLTLRVTVR
ncbi:MAG TPA: protease inhibitor I42 family protein [Gaiellaceae bacterium]|nr:protease inhibitor I42 family protein [Gaiellaceae bacterium]